MSKKALIPYHNVFIKDLIGRNIKLYYYNDKEIDKVKFFGKLIRKYINPRYKIKSPRLLEVTRISELGKKNVFLHQKLKKIALELGYNDKYIILREKEYPSFLYLYIESNLVARTEEEIYV